MICPKCKGERWYWLPNDKEATPCYTCRGSGEVPEPREPTEFELMVAKIVKQLKPAFDKLDKRKYTETNGLEGKND